MIFSKNRIVWLTGQPGSGKSELAKLLYDKYQKNNSCIIIDGDDLRQKTGNFDYSKEGRDKNINNAQLLARFLYYSGYVVIVALVSPYRDLREQFKKEFVNNIYEVYVHCDDLRGKEEYHVANYEQPKIDYLDLDTTTDNPKQSAKKIVDYVDNRQQEINLIGWV